MQNSKNILRKKALKILSAIDFKTKKEKSKLIENKVLNLSLYKESKVVMLFVGKSDEVQTINLLKKIVAEKEFVVLPRINLSKEMITAHKISNLNNLKLGAFNILEPPGKIFNKKNINLILAPGLFFTKEGVRLGRGKAIYDKFLSGLEIYPQKNFIPKIGLCFEKQIIKKLPQEANDIKMDYLITERRIIKCQTKN